MTTSNQHASSSAQRIKCVVWDLDNTVWSGILLEGDATAVRPEVFTALDELDKRGLLHSVASRNDPDAAMARLRTLGIDQYFLHPQIGWGAKSASIAAIREALNIGMDAIAFVDDQPFERAEVKHTHPEVLCIDAAAVANMLERPELMPRFLTDESQGRRQLYRTDIERQTAEASFAGASQDFLSTLDLRLTLHEADEQDLARVEELTVRTHQLNATGYTYSYEELDQLRDSPKHTLLVAGLQDRFGSYGKIGVALVERHDAYWVLKLLLMSCRVMSRGVGSLLLNYLIASARKAGVTLRAEMLPTDKNRAMFIAYRFAGFSEHHRNGEVIVLEHTSDRPVAFPAYATIDAHTPSLERSMV